MSDQPAAERAWQAWWMSRTQDVGPYCGFLAGHASRDAEVAALQIALKPIPCSERLPEKGQTVLALLRCPGLFTFPWIVAHYENAGFEKRENVQRFLWLDVSHWLPLPTIPTESDQ